jgi:hypothetical protein
MTPAEPRDLWRYQKNFPDTPQIDCIFTLSFQETVVVGGEIPGRVRPFMASSMVTGEGRQYMKPLQSQVWRKQLIIFYEESNDDETSPNQALALYITVPTAWDTHLFVSFLSFYTRSHDTLCFKEPTGCFDDIFEWFIQDADAIRSFLADKDADIAIQIEEEPSFSSV